MVLKQFKNTTLVIDMYSYLLVPILMVFAYIYKLMYQSKEVQVVRARAKLHDGTWSADFDNVEYKYVEVEYIYDGNMYKYITTTGDDVPCPKPGPGWILDAWVSHLNDQEDNVTDKLLEYAGPGEDFHDCPVDFRRMFPEGHMLHIRTIRSDVHTIDLEHNEELIDVSGTDLKTAYNINLSN